MFNLENPIDINNVFIFCKSKEIEINGDELFSEIVISNDNLQFIPRIKICYYLKNGLKF